MVANLALLHLQLQVDHPNCIRLFDVYITPRKVYIVTELVTGGELLDRYAMTLVCRVSYSRCICQWPHNMAVSCRVTEKGNYTEKDAANIIKQILEGVAYLHSHGRLDPAFRKVQHTHKQ